MVLLRVMLLLSLLGISNGVQAEDLDQLLTSLSGAKNSVPAVTTDEPKAPEPVAEPKEQIEAGAVEPFQEPKETIVSRPVEPEVAKAESPFEPKFAQAEPASPKEVEPIVRPVLPKVAVTPAFETAKPAIAAPGVFAAPGAKIVAAPTPIVAKATESDVGEEKVQLKITDVHDVSADGLDTLHIDSGGNWLEKRIWYKKAEQLFEVIRTVIQKASDIRMKFIHEVNQVGQHIDEFYENTGFQKGQLEELLQAVVADIATEKNIRGGDLSSDERSIRLKVHADQQALQSMVADFKLIEDLDDQIDKTMMKAFKEIDACRALETKAWNNFKDIGMELDDKKARVLYYEMENFHKNIEQKLNYLQTNLLHYLQFQLVTKVDQTTVQIKSGLQTLHSKGLAMQTLLEKDAHGDFVVLQQRDNAKAQADAEKNNKPEPKDVEPTPVKTKKSSNVAWYQVVVDMLVNYGSVAFDKISGWCMIALCCIQTLLCKLQEMICRMIGN